LLERAASEPLDTGERLPRLPPGELGNLKTRCGGFGILPSRPSSEACDFIETERESRLLSSRAERESRLLSSRAAAGDTLSSNASSSSIAVSQKASRDQELESNDKKME
jgi:hypothetical protein